VICDTTSPMRIHYGRAGLPAATLARLSELYRELGSHYKVAEAIGRTPQSVWQVLKRIGVITPKKRLRGVLFKGEKFTPDYQGFMRSTTFASRKKGCTRFLHRIVWEERHGKIKKRERKTHMFLFRDGNRGNCALSNLMFVSRKEAAKYRAWNGNGYTKWRERHDELTRNVALLEHAGADQSEIDQARLALESQPAWKGNGDPKKRRRTMLRRWARRTPEQRAEVIARSQRSKKAKRAERYAALPEYAIAMLSEREQEVLRRHMRDGETCEQIGRSLGLCHATPHTIKRRALKKIPAFAAVIEARVASIEKWILREAYLIAPKYRLSPDDLAQEGRKHAFRAAQLFDDSRGVKFLSYCARGIAQRMHRSAQDTCKAIRVPAGKFFSDHVTVTSMDAPASGEDSDGDTLGDLFFGDAEITTGSLDFADRAVLLNGLLAKLSPRDEQIVRALFFENKTQEEVAGDFGLTRGGIHMVKRAALKRIRKMPELKRLRAAA
jgi:RNA polymerase sigma factor (sigma-70 family)